MSEFFRGKKVLVTGGTGTIGPILVKRLLENEATVSVVSLDGFDRAKAVLDDVSIFSHANLRDYKTCLKYAEGQDYIFHLMSVKGSTQIGFSKVASAYVPFLLCNTNMMEVAFRSGVKRYLFVGSIGEYPPLPLRHEDDVWNGAPAANDRFMGIAKRAGEIQAEAYLYEYGWDAVRIVRLSNVYGPYDDFDLETAHVIPALIRKMSEAKGRIKVSGDGSAIRDFIYSEDVVEAMIRAIETAPPCLPINIGSGVENSIKTVAETIADLIPQKLEIEWDPTGLTGDKVRILDVRRAAEILGFKPKTPLREGIRKTIDWYVKNRGSALAREKIYA